jgi:hypothetical protein
MVDRNRLVENSDKRSAMKPGLISVFPKHFDAAWLFQACLYAFAGMTPDMNFVTNF